MAKSGIVRIAWMIAINLFWPRANRARTGKAVV